ncbi:PREDICTED: amidase 1 [Ipomoea nil]|uniref:amidase 1 n=1 Tax=Ipomoea nil TaxID=35883 RepID=UPI00090091FA|nr:PREDICTED: amidase 1 [Ipomoea nil]XP_019187670.1 PREDICTED: amidase 1 [Ipomoea nil]XP_019187671.1 PREDICTED: amidase 1 [Ipomoea nil]XP_019187672.1 PREDICTED: amidase 1 [Ipomoea nil]XP_019187673.1 PREDICTED: amidase 1 [Ipomoea nil]
MEKVSDDYGAFIDKFTLQPNSSSPQLPLHGLTFAVKDIFDVNGYVTGFGNPDWARTHSAATSNAPVILDLLKAGATGVGKTFMDEMAYSINGENIHYGTPRNPCAADRVPGGSSSGSAVAVGAMLVDFSLGTDTGGSVRVPASYCGIFGIRPSHGVVSTTGVIPMAQSFDTVGWFARDSSILKRVGKVLLPSQDLLPVRPNQIIIAEDCFKLQDFWGSQFTKALINSIEKLYGRETIKHTHLGEIVKENVPSLKPFMSQGSEGQEYIPSLLALSNAMRLLQRYEFKENHGEWVSTIKPNLGPGIAERVWEALKTTDEKIDVCLSVKAELKEALAALLGDAGILAIPTVPGPPPKLQTDPTSLEAFRVKAFSLLSIAGVSGFCQVNIPLGVHGNLPVGISLLAKHGSDLFLLDIVDTIYGTLKEQVELLKE